MPVPRTETSAWCYKRDRYDRAVCHVRVGAQDIQEALIAKGYAWYAFQFAHELDADQRARYQEAEQRARDQRIGLWWEPDPMPPGNAGNTSEQVIVRYADSALNSMDDWEIARSHEPLRESHRLHATAIR